MAWDSPQANTGMVRWFRADPAAKVIPFPTRFASGNWTDPEQDWPGAGEIHGEPRPYDKGSRDPDLTGQRRCGPDAWFRDGAPTDAPAVARNWKGIAECCYLLPFGLVLGGHTPVFVDNAIGEIATLPESVNQVIGVVFSIDEASSIVESVSFQLPADEIAEVGNLQELNSITLPSDEIAEEAFFIWTNVTWRFIFDAIDEAAELVEGTPPATADTIDEAAEFEETESLALYLQDSIDEAAGFDKTENLTLTIVDSIDEAAAVEETLSSSLMAGMVSYFRFQESGGNRVDLIGPNTLTESGTVGSRTGHVESNAADFTGTAGSYLSVGSNGSPEFGDTDFTFAGWVVVDDVSGAGRKTFVSKWETTGNNRCYVAQKGGGVGRLTSSISSSGGGATENNTGNSYFSSGTWYFMQFRYDALANEWSQRKNDEAWDTASHSGGEFGAAVAFTVGVQSLISPANYLVGAMEQWGIWHRKLSTEELDYLFNSGAGRVPPFLG